MSAERTPAPARPQLDRLLRCLQASLFGLALACSTDQIDLGAGPRPRSRSYAPPATISTAGTLAPTLPVAPGPLTAPVLLPPSGFEPPGISAVLSSTPTPLPPISGGTLAVSSDGKLAVAADPDRDLVYLVDVAERRVRSVMLEAGSEPGRVVLDDSGYAHVALRGGGAVARIAIADARLVAASAVCQFPRGLAIDFTRGELLCACASGELVQLDLATHAERARKFLALDLRDILVTDGGARFVTRYRSAELLALDDDAALASRSTPAQLALSSVGTATASSMGAIATGPALAWRTIKGPDGSPWMLHQRSQATPLAAREHGYASNDRCAAVSRPSLTAFDALGQPRHSMQLGDRAALAVDVAFSADGQWFAFADPAAFAQSDPSVHVLNASRLQQLGSIDPLADSTAAGPSEPGSCWLPGALGLMTTKQATSVAFDSAGLLYVLSRYPARLDIFWPIPDDGQAPYIPAAQLVHSITLSDNLRRDSGHDIFHADVGSGLSCASCHGEALDDGRVWHFVELGPRRTQNLRGGLSATLPLHWNGEFSDMRVLVDEVLTKRMGGFTVSDPYAQALVRWLDKLPALRLAGADDAAAARGQLLFESRELHCNGCHGGAALTNNATVDVGTGGSFQVPSLRGLALRAPFMHDGCAADLEARFTRECGGDRHADTSQLSPDALSDLIAYLKTL